MTIENTFEEPILHEVFAVRATRETDVFVVDVELTDINGERYRCDYVSRPEDTFGIAPTVREWLATEDHDVVPFVEPTIEKKRAGFAPISPRQLRLALVRSGTSLAAVYSAIDALPAGPARDEAEIEWEYATSFTRLAPALLVIAGALGLSAEAVDDLWATALAI